MRIRPATVDDVERLAPLFDGYRRFYRQPGDLDGAAAFLDARLRAGESVVFVAEDGDRMVGFVQLYPIFSSTRMARLWLLNDLFVHAEARGCGASVALIDACKAHCATTGGCGLILETERSNAVANRLYERTGFTLDRDHHYYSWESLPA